MIFRRGYRQLETRRLKIEIRDRTSGTKLEPVALWPSYIEFACQSYQAGAKQDPDGQYDWSMNSSAKQDIECYAAKHGNVPLRKTIYRLHY